MDVVRIDRLCKHYGRAQVLHDVTMTVRAGSLFGFLGPNGAGKSTTIRILLGLLRATSGHAAVLGHDVWRGGPTLRTRVGYLPGDVRFYDHLSGRATLAFFNAARGGGAEREIARLAERFDLDLNKRVRRYSRGMKQKLGLIQALMHRPELLILDEPTTALDPLVRQTLFDELRAVAAEGRTVLFSSHTLSEVEELCDEVAIVRRGRLIEHDRIEVLRNRAVRRVEAFLPPGRHPPPPPEGLRIARHQDGVLEGAWVGAIDPLLGWLREAAVTDVVIAPPDLEDLFLAYYGDVRPAEAS